MGENIYRKHYYKHSAERERKRRENEDMLKRYDLIAQAKKQRVIPDLVYQKNVLNLPDAFTLDKKIYHRIDKDTVNVLYNLTYTNMHLLYEQSTWKWNEKKELADLRSNASRFLMIHHQSDNTYVLYNISKIELLASFSSSS